MAEDVVIRAEGLGKKYAIGHAAEREPYVALRDVLVRGAHNLWRSAADMARGRAIVVGDSVEEFWALKDISFEVKRGEVLGIIGRNGAGKSTLLKILSRITEPTEGRVTIRGRVASLLEVGTGFHPELTGRENIYLNGAILGMTRREMARKFDEIVTFAEVEKFLDTPVKRYSSGMYVRLAFSVAAHLEPEILIIDEVLAVGDAKFQEKCIERMKQISTREGCTILFVSHNLGLIRQLAKRGLLLDNGSIVFDGPIEITLSAYVSNGTQLLYITGQDHDYELPHVSRIQVATSRPNGIHEFGQHLEIIFWLRHDKPMRRACFSFQIVDQFQRPAVHTTALYPQVIFGRTSGESKLLCRFPDLKLNAGNYYLRTYLSEPPGEECYERLDAICPFQIAQPERTVSPWRYDPGTSVYHERYFWECRQCDD
jgi:lipopolysaccharide transport system ATP-binding protein